MAAHSGPDGVTDGLVLALDAGNTKSYPKTGATWFDLSGNDFDTALGNSPTFSTANQGVLTFNGSSQFADTPTITGVTSNWTVCIWFYPTSVSNYENPIDCNYGHPNGSGNVGPRLEMDSSNNLVWVWSGDSSNSNFYTSLASSGGLTQSVWHFAALSRTSSNTVINFLDGEVKTTTINTVGSPSATFVNEFTNVNIGRGFSLGGAERYFTGNISTVKLYNRALTAAELLQNYYALKTRVGL